MDERALQAWAEHRPGQHHPVDTVCVAPWVSMEFDPSGWVYTCCASQLYPLGRIGEQRLAELWGGHRATVLRESLRRADLTVACGTCRWHLEHRRMDPVAAVYDRLPVESPDPQWPHMMLFALSNRCNLGCVMCTPELSSTLRSGAGLEPLESPYGDSFFDDLAPFLEHLHLVKFTGGEPFLAPEHKRIWDLLAALGATPKMHVTTNGTVWTDTVEKVLDRFDVDISISVDAASAGTYAEVRRGGDFDALMVNIDRFDEATRSKGTSLHVSYCLLDQNAHELAEFLTWAERFAIPASVNLVVDEGLALHDRELDRLEEVQRAWEEDERGLASRLGANRPVWDTQRAQLDSVIAERRRGIPPPPRRAIAVERSMFSIPGPPQPGGDRILDHRRVGGAAEHHLADEIERLRRWSCGGDVAVVFVERTGLISEVRSANPRLGIHGDSVIGRHIEDLPSCIEAADGRRAWIIDMDQIGDTTIRTLALSQDAPVRGSTGLAVRTVQVPADDGWFVLLAEDTIYERAPRANRPPEPDTGGTLRIR